MRLWNSALLPSPMRLLQLRDMILNPLMASLGFLAKLRSGVDVANGAGWKLLGDCMSEKVDSLVVSSSTVNKLCDW